MDDGPYSKCDNISRAIDHANRYVYTNGDYNDVDANADADANANADPIIITTNGGVLNDKKSKNGLKKSGSPLSLVIGEPMF